MPELPEVERVRQTLLPHVLGRRVLRAELRRADICNRGRGAAPAELLEGCEIAGIQRRGKQLAITATSGAVLCVHLGMTGQLVRRAGGPDGLDHVHAVWEFAEGVVVFRDPRRFGRLWTLPSAEALGHHWAGLGPDALEVEPEHLDAARRGRRTIKAVLLDQQVLAGVGNIYADEALFVAGIRPTRRVNRLRSGEPARLAEALRGVLKASIEAGGSSLRDFVNADNEPGYNQTRLLVYGRAGLPCTRCGAALRGLRLGQRATVLCPKCQV